MKKILVLYGSHYGSTKRYAEVIANKLNAQVKDVEKAQDKDLEDADIIIYGGGIYAGKLVKSNLLKKQENLLLKKKLLIFSCGNADPEKEIHKEALRDAIKNSLGETLWTHAECFHLHGDLLYSKMSFIHRMMMKVMISMLKKEKQPDEEAKLMIHAYTHREDIHFFREESADVLIACAKSLIEDSL